MTNIQPLSSEEDILKEAQSALPSAAPSSVSDEAKEESQDMPSQIPGDVKLNPNPNPNPSSFRPDSEPIDLKPFHYALPVQNYILATIILGYVGIAGSFSLINFSSLLLSVGSGIIGGSGWASILIFILLTVLGVALLKNKREMRTVAVVIAALGVAYWGYQLFAMMLGMFGAGRLMFALAFESIGAGIIAAIIIVYGVPFGIMLYTLLHLNNWKTKKAYR